MGIINWHKLAMTSHTTPAPFEARASSEYTADYGAYMAFNGAFNDSPWATVIHQQNNSWIRIDYGEPRRVNKVELSTRVQSSVSQTPTRFKVQGSDDRNTWEDLGYYHVPSWVALTSYVFDVKESNYRHYRIFNIASNASYASWAQIRFGHEEVSVNGYYQKGTEKFILKGKEKLTIPSEYISKYSYSDLDEEVEWSDDITRTSVIRDTDGEGRLTLQLEDPSKYHTVRGKN